MSDMLSIGSSGVAAYQRALLTVSNNIANVSTDGYSRQDVTVTANQPTQAGGSYMGTGAHFDNVRRQYDAFVESNLRNSSSDLKSQEPLLSYVNRLIDVMGDQSIGLTSAMNQFFESAQSLASDSASTVSRSIFLRDADGLASRFRQLSSQFELLSNETAQSIDTDIGQVNSLTQQLAQVNSQLARKSDAADQPAELLDQRDLLLRQLSGLTSIKTRFGQNGSVLVSVGDMQNQGILVRDDTSSDIIVQTSSSGELQLNYRYPPTDPNTGKKQALPPISSGKIGGLLVFREQVLQPAQGALDNLAKVTTTEVNTIHTNGIDADGLLGGDLFGFSAGQDDKAGGMQLLIKDAARVAAAGQFRVTDNSLNQGTAQASIQYDSPTYAGPTQLAGDLALARSPQITSQKVDITTQGYVNVGLVKAGTRNLVLKLNSPSSTQSLQVFTRDGRQLLGTDLSSSPNVLNGIVKASNGMEAGATFSGAQRNAGLVTTGNTTEDQRYLDMDLLIGAKASPLYIQQFNTSTSNGKDLGAPLAPQIVPAELQGRQLSASTWKTALAHGAFTLNGRLLKPAASENISSASDLVTWINALGIDGVTASLSTGGGLRLAQTDPAKDIRLGLSASGTPDDLNALGFDTSVYISGTTQDDLLVFATDTATPAVNSASTVLSSGNITAQFEGVSGELKQMLRTQALEIKFTTATHYQIRDTRTDTLLAERDLDTAASPAIHYRGLTLNFSNFPKAGDKFSIDGNTDGIGNNEAMLKLIDLEKSKVMPGNLTITESYIERVNQVGNVAKQAAIAKQALTVVFQQAQQAHDSVAGVSLDQEASDLVRYQQAYQANAKVMQVASALFDAILQTN